CFEGAGAPAFWPWVQILRAYGRTPEAGATIAALGTAAAEIAQLAPELVASSGAPHERGARTHDDAWSHGPDAAAARFHLFDALATFFRTAAQRHPLLLMLDDLHWADAPSLLCLQFLAREIQDAAILVIGTYRDAELDSNDVRARTLAGLGRDRGH